MAITIELPAVIEEMLRDEAARSGQAIGEYVSALAQELLFVQAVRVRSERTRPQTLEDLKPRIPPPPGSNGLALVFGQWPGDETAEDLLAALKEMG
jgi:hypothetical protein